MPLRELSGNLMDIMDGNSIDNSHNHMGWKIAGPLGCKLLSIQEINPFKTESQPRKLLALFQQDKQNESAHILRDWHLPNQSRP